MAYFIVAVGTWEISVVGLSTGHSRDLGKIFGRVASPVSRPGLNGKGARKAERADTGEGRFRCVSSDALPPIAAARCD